MPCMEPWIWQSMEMREEEGHVTSRVTAPDWYPSWSVQPGEEEENRMGCSAGTVNWYVPYPTAHGVDTPSRRYTPLEADTTGVRDRQSGGGGGGDDGEGGTKGSLPCLTVKDQLSQPYPLPRLKDIH